MSPRSAPQNHLLSTLSQSDFGLLQPHLTAVVLTRRLVVEESNKPILQIYFPDSGLLSIVTANLPDHPMEVGIIGREGMSGTAVVMGNDRSPQSNFVQVEGHGQSMAADALRTAMQDSPSLRLSLLQFVQAFLIQTAHTAAANSRAKVEERLARWLLMGHDRLDGDEIPLTHEFLALMLGVRRAGVTVAFGLLEKRALVSTKRGVIVVDDRAGLEELAGGFYGVPEAEYLRLTGWHTKH
jgi:CRP-like cAMP-binding protein